VMAAMASPLPLPMMLSMLNVGWDWSHRLVDAVAGRMNGPCCADDVAAEAERRPTEDPSRSNWKVVARNYRVRWPVRWPPPTGSAASDPGGAARGVGGKEAASHVMAGFMRTPATPPPAIERMLHRRPNIIISVLISHNVALYTASIFSFFFT
jgi:hypothetical protein